VVLPLLRVWIWILIIVFIDIFRSHDLSGWGKAGWVIFVVILPFLGVLFYLIFRGKHMQERAMRGAAKQQVEFQRYVHDVAASSSSADQLAKLADLKDKEVLTDPEFEAERPRSCPHDASLLLAWQRRQERTRSQV
jgi:hypothetical protein